MLRGFQYFLWQEAACRQQASIYTFDILTVTTVLQYG